MPRPAAKKAPVPAAADLLLEPCLVALRKQLLALQLEVQEAALHLPEAPSQDGSSSDTTQQVMISGFGCEGDG